MSERKTVLVIGGMRSAVGRQILMSEYLKLFIRGSLEVPDAPILKTEPSSHRDRISNVDPRHNKKMPPHKTILRNHR